GQEPRLSLARVCRGLSRPGARDAADRAGGGGGPMSTPGAAGMTPEQLAELKARVTQAVEDRGGIRRKGSSWVNFPGPNSSEHKRGDRRPSAGWDADRGVWKCLGCSWRGGTKALAERLGIALPPQRDPRETCRWEIRDTGGRLHARHIRLEPGRDGKSKD